MQKKQNTAGKKELDENELVELLSPKHKLDLKIQRIFEELPENSAIMVMENLKIYSIINARMVKYLTKKGRQGVYVTVNRGSASLIDNFKRHKVDIKKVKFVDAITKLAENREPETGDIEYLDSPRDLLELSFTIEKAVKKLGKEKKFVVIDSVSTLLVYNKPGAVEKFVHSLAGKMRKWEAQGIFIIMESTKKEVINTLVQFCDQIVTM